MNAAGRTVLTLQPLLDEVAPGARKTLTQCLQNYDIVRTEIMSAHITEDGVQGRIGQERART